MSDPLGNQTAHGCIDIRGQAIPHGLLFYPGPDECQVCTCFNGTAGLCRTVLCAPPQTCQSLRVGDRCCEWICLDDIHPHGGNIPDGNGTADTGLRLVASGVTAILSLALLFFLIYRLRQRKLSNRRDRQQEDDQSMDSVTVNPAFSMAGLSAPGEDIPRTERGNYLYSFAWWKPPFEARTAPPSYDDAVFHGGSHGTRIIEDGPPSDSDSGSDAPPYDEIHLDPIIRASPQRPLPSGAALVMPVSVPESYHLNHVERGDELPSSVHRLAPRSREAIVLPREERDAVLHRFSLQLNLNVSSGSSTSSAVSPDGRTASPMSATSSE